MASLGWQELLVLLFVILVMLLLTILPIVVVWHGSKRRTGQVAVGWVILAVIIGWLGVLLWMTVGPKAPTQRTPLVWNHPPS
jgi:hypothetical protein